MCDFHHFKSKVAYICATCDDYKCIKCNNHHFKSKVAYICATCEDYKCIKCNNFSPFKV